MASNATVDTLAILLLYGCSSEQRTMKTVKRAMEITPMNVVDGSVLAKAPCTANTKGISWHPDIALKSSVPSVPSL